MTNTMNILIDILTIIGTILMGLWCIYRSHYNFTKGYVRLGYVYLLLWLLACIVFFAHAFYTGL
jgi:hypothetical protein